MNAKKKTWFGGGKDEFKRTFWVLREDTEGNAKELGRVIQDSPNEWVIYKVNQGWMFGSSDRIGESKTLAKAKAILMRETSRKSNKPKSFWAD